MLDIKLLDFCAARLFFN